MAHTLRHSRAARLVLALLLAAVVLTSVAVASASAVTTRTAAAATADDAGSGAGQGAGRGAGQGAGTASGNGVGISIDTGKDGGSSTAVQVLVVLTVLSLAPSILLLMTGFTRILIVMGFVRNALGTPNMPPNQVLIGLSLFLTLFVMFPTFSEINKTAVQPYQAKKITQTVALDNAQKPIREFMFRQVDEKDLALFVRLADEKRPETRADVPTHVLIPAFLISELKTAFQIGFLIFIPFLIIDMVVASTLMSMGMIMLPPVMISLPFKILLFVLVDGWGLTIESLVKSFGGT
ncbi:MAG: fliP [Thermoleophilia bacterium]|nr:fliP [Thermoleophilia bacterium]